MTVTIALPRVPGEFSGRVFARTRTRIRRFSSHSKDDKSNRERAARLLSPFPSHSIRFRASLPSPWRALPRIVFSRTHVRGGTHLLKAIHYDSKIISSDSSRQRRGRHPIKPYVAASEATVRIRPSLLVRFSLRPGRRFACRRTFRFSSFFPSLVAQSLLAPNSDQSSN